MQRLILVAAVTSSLLLVVAGQGYGGYGGYAAAYGGYGAPSAAPAGGPPSEPSPSPAPISSPVPSTTPSGPGNCVVTAYITAPWPLWKPEAAYAASLNFFVVNNQNYTTNTPWNFGISSPAYKSIEQTWNWDDVTVTGSSLSGKAGQDWQALSPGLSVNLGGVVGADTNSTDAFKPQTATINGESCSIEVVT